MHPNVIERLLLATDASGIDKVEHIQSLWSGFGAIERVHLEGGNRASLIVKSIQPPDKMQHPRGWNSDLSAKRKMRSYEIEKCWYENYANRISSEIKVPQFLFQVNIDSYSALVMEDLHTSGFTETYDSTSKKHFDLCLKWLAQFHAEHLHHAVDGLWPVGTYWHLATRQEELEAMESGELKNRAKEINDILSACKFQTIVHGDAKPPNFCFNPELNNAAAVDFQYVGRGCGMKDVMYLMSSALEEEQLIRDDEQILDRYFKLLRFALEKYGKDSGFDSLENEWRAMYKVAWLDFIRFLEGWSPESKRLNVYTNLITRL